jgi:developmental checkpoint coupling sporulation initiation to replication initiation
LQKFLRSFKKIYALLLQEKGGGNMGNLVDELLLISYYKAKKLNLEREFILILEKEIKRRGLPLTDTLIKYYME